MRDSYSSFVSSNLSTADRSENSPGRAFGSVLSTLTQLNSCRPYDASVALSSLMSATGASLASTASEERYRRRTWYCCAMPVIGTSLSCALEKYKTRNNRRLAGRQVFAIYANLATNLRVVPRRAQLTLSWPTVRSESNRRSEWVSGEETKKLVSMVLR